MINPNIFRAYDIRGIADPTEQSQSADLTEETAYLIGRGTGTYLKRKYNTKNMAVGKDCRLTGEKLEKAFISGVLEAGLDVCKIGLSISPMVYWASCQEEFDSATNITASHNPKEYNGFKTVVNNAHSICGDELQEVLKIIQEEDFEEAKKGEITEKDIWPSYKKDLLKRIELKKPLKIVIDTGNGAAGPFVPELFKELGCEVFELYTKPDGNFPNHEANPEELENMKDLIAKVKEVEADIGFGFDGDGDRVGVVDETGHMFSADFMILLLARELVKKHKNPKVVFDVKVSQTIINEMEKIGVDPIMSKTGHSFIERKMKEVAAPLAGEVSGHLFFGDDYYGFDDAALAALKIAEIVAKSDKKLSNEFKNLPKTFTTPEFKARTPDDAKFEIVESLVSHFTKNYDCITIDGVRVKFSDKNWAAVRASNTSPNLTLRFEADSKEELKRIQKIMVEELKKHPKVSLDWYKDN